jgi:hypothetical protein
VTDAYTGAFPFSGTLHSVVVDVGGDVIRDDEAAMKQLLARQ